MNKLSFAFFLITILVSSCKDQNHKLDSKIDFSYSDDNDQFLNMVSEIRLIKLRTDTSLVLGSDLNLICYKNEYFIVDKNGAIGIQRFSNNGDFINSIAKRGRGPNEFIRIKNAQIFEDTVYIFSSPNLNILKFCLSGEYIGRDSINISAQQAFKTHHGYFGYTGYGMDPPFRFIEIRDTSINYLYKSEEKVLNFTENANVFNLLNDTTLLIRETYNNKILKYNFQNFTNYLEIDFKDYSLKHKFFEFGDPFKSAEFLLKYSFASILQFYENERYKVIEVLINQKRPEFQYAIFDKRDSDNKWVWFSLGKVNESVFPGNLKGLVDNKLIFIIDPTLLEYLSDEEKHKISNIDSLSVNNDVNYLLAEFILK